MEHKKNFEKMKREAGKNRITANSINMIRLEKKLGAKVFHRSKMLTQEITYK